MSKTKINADPDRILRSAREIHRYLTDEENWDLTYSQVQRALRLGRLPSTRFGEVFMSSPRVCRRWSVRFAAKFHEQNARRGFPAGTAAATFFQPAQMKRA
jgi:hypothetical protein